MRGIDALGSIKIIILKKMIKLRGLAGTWGHHLKA